MRTLSKYFAFALTLSLLPLQAQAEKFSIDNSHTKVGFSIRHLGISNVHGSFTEVEGTIDFDKDDIAASSVEATISVKSIDTDNQKRDDHLRSPDFFEASKYPAMKFTSKKITDVKGNEFTIVGDLEMHGVTKEVSLATTFEGAVTDPWGNDRVGFSASTRLNRKDFGLSWNKLLETGGVVVGEEVKITLEIEGIKEK